MLELDDHYVRAEFAAYGNEDGASEGLIVVLQDVTEQRRAEQMQREFVANVSHELRTPITTVKSYVETILDGNVREEEMLVSFLSVINKEADRMTSLIGELLELSRIDNRQVQLRMEEVDLTDLLRDWYPALSDFGAEKGADDGDGAGWTRLCWWNVIVHGLNRYFAIF